jgi:hypothetical protein
MGSCRLLPDLSRNESSQQFCHDCSEPQNLDKQPSNSFPFKGGFCHGQEQAAVHPSFKARIALEAIREKQTMESRRSFTTKWQLLSTLRQVD